MSHNLASKGRKLALQVLASQLGATLIGALVLLGWLGGDAGISALAGGAAALLPHAVFSALAFRWAGARAARQVVLGFFQGEAAKMVLTVFLIMSALQWHALHGGAFFSTYILALATAWLAPLVLQRQ